MTLRNRVSVAAAVGVLIVVAAVSSVLYFSYAASLHSRVDAALVDAAQQASAIASRIQQSVTSGREPKSDIGEPVTVGSVAVQLFPGVVAAGQPTPFGPLDSRDIAVAEQAQPAYFADARHDGQHFRVYTAAWPGNSGGLVRTSRAADADDGALRNAALLLAGLTVAAAGITYGAARLTAGRILRPIAELTAAAEHVTQTRDLTARLGATGTNDEVGRLGSSFDTMLAALHESVTAQRQLVADASHELRTPLTSLTTNLDLLEDGAGLADPQAPALVRAAREQAGELDQLITDLLDLARYHESAPHRETVRLDLLTSEAVHRVRQRTPHAAIAADLRPCLVHVDPAGVDHAICNLIDNAIKWNPPDGTVHVVVADAHVSVTDSCSAASMLPKDELSRPTSSLVPSPLGP
ncbi:MAG TPA: HAMP domain-containing sensor histidine kinase, partial [Streptosporangiaceae bacterium]|nr:HAMP domain-containing sensor histidine kinase [Streptosporangiaceae bacterium]